MPTTSADSAGLNGGRRAPRPHAKGYFTIPKAAAFAIGENVEGTGAAFASAVYFALRWLADEERHRDGPVTLTINQIAQRAGCSYNKTADMLKVLAAVGVIGIEDKHINGTKSRAPSVYTFPISRGTPFPSIGGTFPTDRGVVRAEIEKDCKDRKDYSAQAALPLHTIDASTASKVRPRDPLFDALATAEGANLRELTTSAARSIGVALAEIRGASPDVTPDEIARRARNYHSAMPKGTTLTAHALAKHWARYGNSPGGAFSEPVRLGINLRPQPLPNSP